MSVTVVSLLTPLPKRAGRRIYSIFSLEDGMLLGRFGVDA